VRQEVAGVAALELGPLPVGWGDAAAAGGGAAVAPVAAEAERRR
jgi:hypothetical protein